MLNSVRLTWRYIFPFAIGISARQSPQMTSRFFRCKFIDDSTLSKRSARNSCNSRWLDAANAAHSIAGGCVRKPEFRRLSYAASVDRFVDVRSFFRHFFLLRHPNDRVCSGNTPPSFFHSGISAPNTFLLHRLRGRSALTLRIQLVRMDREQDNQITCVAPENIEDVSFRCRP